MCHITGGYLQSLPSREGMKHSGEEWQAVSGHGGFHSWISTDGKHKSEGLTEIKQASKQSSPCYFISLLSLSILTIELEWVVSSHCLPDWVPAPRPSVLFLITLLKLLSAASPVISGREIQRSLPLRPSLLWSNSPLMSHPTLRPYPRPPWPFSGCFLSPFLAPNCVLSFLSGGFRYDCNLQATGFFLTVNPMFPAEPRISYWHLKINLQKSNLSSIHRPLIQSTALELHISVIGSAILSVIHLNISVIFHLLPVLLLSSKCLLITKDKPKLLNPVSKALCDLTPVDPSTFYLFLLHPCSPSWPKRITCDFLNTPHGLSSIPSARKTTYFCLSKSGLRFSPKSHSLIFWFSLKCNEEFKVSYRHCVNE